MTYLPGSKKHQQQLGSERVVLKKTHHKFSTVHGPLCLPPWKIFFDL